MQPERPVQTTLAFHASRIITDAGVLLAMASMSMAFVVSGAGNRSALDADALPVIILLLPIFVVTLIPDHTRPLHPIVSWVALALGLAALPYAFLKMLDAGILADTLDGSVGLGARLMVVGSLVTVLGIGVGIYRSLRGLPAGGTPGRSSAFRTRSKELAAPGSAPRTEAAPAPATAATETTPTRLLPAAAEPEEAVEVDVPATRSSAQPEILFPDTGAVAREADPDPDSGPDGGLQDTAERADAALDDHLMSILDDDPADEKTDDADGAGT